jgi:hypothetical protein
MRMGSPEANREAQRLGFKDYEQLYYWKLRQQERTAPQRIGGTSSLSELWDQAMSWHPAWTMDYVAKKMQGATRK